MTRQPDPPAAATPAAVLRQQAEAAVAKLSEPPAPTTPEQVGQLLHELRVHQIELEMQNEELRVAQVDLATERERYFDLYDLAPVGYCTVSAKGLILQANLTLSVLLGVARGALLRVPLSHFILKEDQDAYYLYRRTLPGEATPPDPANPTGQACELRLTKRNGAIFWAQLTACWVPEDDHDSTCRIVINEITERKQAETVLQMAQKLESLGLLAGGIAHDYNNLLAGIYGFVENAIHTVTDPDARAYLDQAIGTMDRARALTQQLLTFAKGGAPSKVLTRLHALLQETTRFALSGANVSCHFAIAEDLAPCEIDKHQIGQIIDNLVINARQAMPTGGSLEVSAVNVALGPREHAVLAAGNYVKVSVKDSGSGMPAELLSKIFDPFFTTKAQGSGLGLATCYSIAKRHGGAIEVESALGRGSSFHVFLPSCAGVEPARIAPATLQRGTGMIILMDDDATIRASLSIALKMLGYEVIGASDGQAALQAYQSETAAGRPVAAMICDLTIPGGLGGKETAAAMRQRNPLLPLFVASGYSEDAVMQNPATYGFTASLAKPFSIRDLSSVLAQHLQPAPKTTKSAS